MRAKENYSHYEKIRIISARALQISQGAPVLVPRKKGQIDPLELANLEWEAGVIPIESIRRVE
jgi:DNA-directed RNA polymerase subunit K/omega